jgi:protein-tyrosine phosphatase
VWPELYPANTAAAIRAWVEELREVLRQADVEYELWPGGEVRIAPRISGWLDSHGVPTLGSSRAVLVDYWGRDWPTFADELLDWLLERGYQPILAHPERMGLDDAELTRVAESLARRGVWLQGNLRSLAGGEGRQARRQLETLLQRDAVYALATDTHNPEDIDGRLAGIDVLLKLHGPDAATRLLATRSGEILCG